ncbi:hypothetical protein [Streptomyces xanthophaeus]|uniref:hypothetical protein n=1 Tax=Streptomyces xanthophaeus TaxID=67385 RepID=UPI00365F4DD9
MVPKTRIRALATAVVLAAAGLAALTGIATPPPPPVEHQQAPGDAPGAMTPQELADALRNGERGTPGGPLRIGPDGKVLPEP